MKIVLREQGEITATNVLYKHDFDKAMKRVSKEELVKKSDEVSEGLVATRKPRTSRKRAEGKIEGITIISMDPQTPGEGIDDAQITTSTQTAPVHASTRESAFRNVSSLSERESAFRNVKTTVECLADKLINDAKSDSTGKLPVISTEDQNLIDESIPSESDDDDDLIIAQVLKRSRLETHGGASSSKSP